MDKVHNHLFPSKRLKVEAEVRDIAISIIDRYGTDAAEYFHSRFLTLAKEYNEAKRHETTSEYIDKHFT